MSLLGKLFSGATGNAQRQAHSLDSNLEDTFTHNLLFPDAEALCHNDQVFTLSSAPVLPAAVNAYDINGDIDLEMRDVRVIIMQDATQATGLACALFDSHPPPPPSPSPSIDKRVASSAAALPGRSESRRSVSSPRKPSLGQISRPVVIQHEAPRAFGAFDRRSHHSKQLSYTESAAERVAREYSDEIDRFAKCMFGNSEVLAYKGISSKLHTLSDPRSAVPSSYMGDGSLGRSSMRGSKLAQSFTSENLGPGPGPTSAGFLNTSTASRASERKRVLVTRIFPVQLANEDAEDGRTPTGPAPKPKLDGYPFPNVSTTTVESGPGLEPHPSQARPRKTPMYAIGVIISLPQAPLAQSAPASRSSFRGSGSYNEQDSFPSSLNSTRRNGWTMLGHGFGVESLESSCSSDVDDRTDITSQHWDIIMRIMSHLQAVATAALLPMLRQADITSPEPRNHGRAPSASVSISGKRVEDVKPFKIVKASIKHVNLSANCLMPIQKIHKEVDASRQRLVSGIKASQVVTGQGRWGIWREEARTVGKWAGGKDEGFFFFNLLTGFLGSHTEWLQALGPSWYRRRHYQQLRAHRDDDISIPARTIIISDQKLMARRLIFLLSAFLPAAQPTGRPHRPSTSASFGGYSQSPPNYGVPYLKEESLRRRINKKTSGVRGSHHRTTSFPSQTSNGPGLEIHHHRHDRRVSDAASIKTANLPIPGSDIGTRKSSTVTASTATPVTTIPHFSTRRPVRGTGPVPRPGSSGSLATDDLIRSLQRADSTGHYSNGSTDSQGHNSRWGSMISGFWGSKRRESTTESSPPGTEGLGVYDTYPRSNYQTKSPTLVKMVEEANHGGPLVPLTPKQEREMRKSESSAETAKPDSDAGGEVTEQTVHTHERIPHPSGAYESPVKTSISPRDGIIDIDVPLPEYLSFETAVSSPSSSAYSFSTPGLGNGMEGFEHYSRTGQDHERKMRVGGWLPRYNPDFALQAIPTQPDKSYLEDIKASLRAEPTPVLSSTPDPESEKDGRWVDVASAIVADTGNFSIKHIRYRRLVKPIITAPVASNSYDSRYGNVYTAAQLTPGVDLHNDTIEECFIEEPIISMDETLIEAVERIIAQSNSASKTTSVSSSRSPSRHGPPGRERSNSESREARSGAAHLEVPRNECKKMVLTALEDIVRSVVDSREKEGTPSTPHERYEGKLGATERERESFLREGVRAWLGSVETGE